MDASRSMGKPVGGGGTRLAAAKAALLIVVDGLPGGARVGLRLDGHRVSGAGRAAGCRDTELVAPVGALGREALTARIDSYHAVGSTPIGHALRLAAGDLPSGAPGRSCSCPTAATTAPLRSHARSPASWPPPVPASASRRSASRSGPARGASCAASPAVGGASIATRRTPTSSPLRCARWPYDRFGRTPRSARESVAALPRPRPPRCRAAASLIASAPTKIAGTPCDCRALSDSPWRRWSALPVRFPAGSPR